MLLKEWQGLTPEGMIILSRTKREQCGLHCPKYTIVTVEQLLSLLLRLISFDIHDFIVEPSPSDSVRTPTTYIILMVQMPLIEHYIDD